MSKAFHLSKGEKQIEVLLFAIAIISFITVIIRIYSENNGFNIDYLLAPSLFACYAVFFGILTYLGFNKRDMFIKWSYPIFSIILLIITKATKNDNKAKVISLKIISIAYLLTSLLMLYGLVKMLFF